jgi:hypothetical protein
VIHTKGRRKRPLPSPLLSRPYAKEASLYNWLAINFAQNEIETAYNSDDIAHLVSTQYFR